jgi:hypothetical protein
MSTYTCPLCGTTYNTRTEMAKCATSCAEKLDKRDSDEKRIIDADKAVQSAFNTVRDRVNIYNTLDSEYGYKVSLEKYRKSDSRTLMKRHVGFENYLSTSYNNRSFENELKSALNIPPVKEQFNEEKELDAQAQELFSTLKRDRADLKEKDVPLYDLMLNELISTWDKMSLEEKKRCLPTIKQTQDTLNLANKLFSKGE